MVFLKMYYTSAGQTSLLSSVSRDEYFILIIRQLTSRASSDSVVQISGGSTPLAKERAQFFFLTCPADFSFFCDFFLTQRALRASPLYPPLQMDKYKEITGFDVYSVKTVNVLYHVYKHATA